MRTLPSRQVHLDFHTSPHIPGVGSRFDKAQFQAALKEGNVNSITVFAKCHHGYCYYPTRVGTQHPTMKPGFDLTGAMADAAHEIGVAAPLYITTGFSALDAEEHPEWLMLDRDGRPFSTGTLSCADPDAPLPDCTWAHLCLSGDYARHIYDLTREICDRYPVVDGLFYDIVFLNHVCYCPNCVAGMRAEGLDPDSDADAEEYYRRQRLRFMAECTRILHEKHPEATIFFNGGADIYHPEYLEGQSHFELEDLPTAWGGYNKMPPRASFMRRYPKEYLGMTGKFHTIWGEFGGYKNPDALRYEVLTMAMYGAKCSVGDQLPPNGQMDMETYRIIGRAYRALEAIEPWAYPAQSTADLGVYLSGDRASDEGLHNMLLEGHLDFDVISPGDSLDRFRALILPDCTALSDAEAARIRDFAARGGAVLFSGTSAVRDGRFQLDPGADYLGHAACRLDYFRPGASLCLPFGNAPFLCNRAGERTRVTDGEVLAEVYEPWFDRTAAHYCSHKNTPYRDEPAAHPAAVRRGNIVYLAHPLCALYKQDGAQVHREAFLRALRLIYRPLCRVSLPSQGRVRLTYQSAQDRYVLHTAYASPIQRGWASVIEDIVPLYQVRAEIDLPRPAVRVRLVPSLEELPFEQTDGCLRFAIPCVNGHQAVEIDVE